MSSYSIHKNELKNTKFKTFGTTLFRVHAFMWSLFLAYSKKSVGISISLPPLRVVAENV